VAAKKRPPFAVAELLPAAQRLAEGLSPLFGRDSWFPTPLLGSVREGGGGVTGPGSWLPGP